jgi:hypothetical protein
MQIPNQKPMIDKIPKLKIKIGSCSSMVCWWSWLVFNFLRFFFFSIEGWTQDLTLTSQELYPFSHSTIPFFFFCFTYFLDRVLLFAQDWSQTLILQISISWVARITDVSHHALPFFVVFLRQILLCSPGWPWNLSPPALASQMLRFQTCTTTPTWPVSPSFK